jgi:hypothetical protein
MMMLRGRFHRRPLLRHLRLQFGLRSLLIATAIFCLALGWHVERVHRQRQAVAALKQAGARIEYSISRYNHYDMRLERPHGTEALEIDDPRTLGEWLEWLTPERFRRALGVDFFRHVEYINFSNVSELQPVVHHLRDLHGVRIVRLGIGLAIDDDLPAVGQLHDLTHLDANHSTITDAGLIFLAPLRKLKHLDLSANAITGTGLGHLTRLQRLEYLDLQSNPMTDDGLAHLAKLGRIKDLDLSWSNLTGSGLRDLTALSHLESLKLSHTKLKDENVAHLADFRRLGRLYLHFTAVGDAGLRNLRGLSNLKSLGLGQTLVTDGALGSLCSLGGLESLDLSSTAITDSGLRTLGKLASLKKIFIDDTAATAEGVAWLKRRLPKANIDFNEQGNVASNQARVLIDVGLWHQALETLSKAESSYLQSTLGLRDLGQCHAGLAQWDDAEREYCQALELISQNPSEQWWYNGAFWRELYAWPELFERVAQARPDDAWRWIVLAQRAVIDGRWSDAVDDYARAVACPHILDPLLIMHGGVEDSIDFQFGVSRLFAGDIAGARRVRDRLVDGDPRIEEFNLRPPNGYDYNLFAAAHLQLLAPQGAFCPPRIASWLRGGNEWYHKVLLPLIYLRSGEYAQVLAKKQTGQNKEDFGRFWFSQAMAHHYLRQQSEARLCHARGTQWLDRRIKEARIHRRYDYACGLLEAEVLRREAERLISGEN